MKDEPDDRPFLSEAQPTKPPMLPYASAGMASSSPRSSSRNHALKFFIGFFGGIGISATYLMAAHELRPQPDFLLYSICVKIALAITLLCFRRWRLIGGGILTSMALMALLFGAGLVYAISTCKGWG